MQVTAEEFSDLRPCLFSLSVTLHSYIHTCPSKKSVKVCGVGGSIYHVQFILTYFIIFHGDAIESQKLTSVAFVYASVFMYVLKLVCVCTGE